MKKLLLILVCYSFASCSGWSNEDKDAYMHSCREGLNGVSDEKATSYCQCNLDVLMKKYPNVEKLMENMDKVASDPDVQACKERLK